MAFLNLHPDFVKRFNQYLDPDKQVQTSGPNTLSIELRIYALISLGVTDSTSIAEFLHYSPQTIYNYRSKIRHSSSLPQKDFDETIEKMYYS
jgi:DNA-binding NarL/FixJ family response regulator